MQQTIWAAGARIARRLHGLARRAPVLLALSALIAANGPTQASASESMAAMATALGVFQRDDARLQAIGWRLTVANASFCRDARPAIGLLLQDVMNYDDPEGIRRPLGISGDIAIEAVAPASPAADAGLTPNEEIMAIDSAQIAALPPGNAGDFARLNALHDRIDASLAKNGRVTLLLRRPDGEEREVELAGLAACPGRFELRIQGQKAQADGARVLIGQRFGESDRPADSLEEGEFAAVVAHELAHNLLGHRDRLDGEERDWDKVRNTEREADRLSVWLLANARYDPAVAPQLMRGRGRRNDWGQQHLPTHESWDRRAETIEAEIVRVLDSIARRGAADWSRDFARE